MTSAANAFDLTSADFKRDPHPTCRAMLEAGPVVPVRLPIVGEVMFATRHASVELLLKDDERFSVDLVERGRSGIARLIRWMPGPLKLLSENMLQKDDPEHRRLRKLVDAAFRRRDIDTLRPAIEKLADDMITDLARSEDRDIVRHVARDLPLAVICDLLGLPHEDRGRFTKWMNALSDVNSIFGMTRLIPALNRINTYLRAQIAAQRKDPGDGLIARLVHAHEDGDQLTDDELLAMCFLLFVAGHETTTHLISGGTLALLQHPEALEALRSNRDLALSATDELLRFVSPVQMTKPRLPKSDLMFEGAPLREGQMVMGLLCAANLDPEVFDNPEALDIARKPNRHLAFGAGPHFCLGAWLARTEMELFLQRLLDRAPHLSLAVPEYQLAWRKGTGMRALKALPVQL